MRNCIKGKLIRKLENHCRLLSTPTENTEPRLPYLPGVASVIGD